MMYHDLHQIREALKAASDLAEDVCTLFPSPPHPYLKYSSSLEALKKVPTQPVVDKAALADKQGASAMKIISFNKNDGDVFTVEKEKVKKQAQSPGILSMLTVSVHQAPPKRDKDKILAASKMSDIGMPTISMTVYVMINAGPLPNKVIAKVIPNATVENLIDTVVRQLNQLIERTRSDDATIIPINSKSCQLMLCEEDGKPDTDTPVLQRDAEITRFGCTCFALCRDPDFNSKAARPIFKVILPSKEYQLLSINEGVTLRHAIEKVCRKRLLDMQLHYVVSAKDSTGSELDLDKNMDDLNTTEVIIRSRTRKTGLLPGSIRHIRSRSRGDMIDITSSIDFTGGGGGGIAPQEVNEKATKKLGLPAQFFFSPADVAQYVQYTVIKINKYGKKQERLMGIDLERITNALPLAAKTGRIHTPFRLINSVQRAYVVDKAVAPPPSGAILGGSQNRKTFCLVYADGVCIYESENADVIVARINFILSLDRDVQRRKSQ